MQRGVEDDVGRGGTRTCRSLSKKTTRSESGNDQSRSVMDVYVVVFEKYAKGEIRRSVGLSSVLMTRNLPLSLTDGSKREMPRLRWSHLYG